MDITWVRSMKSSKFAVLNVQCRNVPIATRVKSTFAALVKSTNKPAYIGDVSISFAHTLGTRVRISLMRAMSKRQKEKDPNATCSVSAFTARPLLHVGGKDQGTWFLSFVDAVAGFRHLLTQEDLDRALSLCSGQKGRLKSKFLVLSDDRTLPRIKDIRRGQDHLAVKLQLRTRQPFCLVLTKFQWFRTSSSPHPSSSRISSSQVNRFKCLHQFQDITVSIYRVSSSRWYQE